MEYSDESSDLFESLTNNHYPFVVDSYLKEVDSLVDDVCSFSEDELSSFDIQALQQSMTFLIDTFNKEYCCITDLNRCTIVLSSRIDSCISSITDMNSESVTQYANRLGMTDPINNLCDVECHQILHSIQDLEKRLQDLILRVNQRKDEVIKSARSKYEL